MYLGIDLGTSGVKAILCDGEQKVVAQATAPLAVSRPRPLWSEQDPEDWWGATNAAVAMLRRDHAPELRAVKAVGLSGQMHGATLLDASDRVLRPAILWNDGRSGEECAELERRVPDLRAITGNRAMAGFTAPKLLWVARHEPDVFAATARILLPKDYLRLRMTGDHASDMSDSAGTLWLDVAARAWSSEVLAATGLAPGHMPELFEGSEATGTLLPEVASAWCIDGPVVVAGGAGDNAAAAIGVGVTRPGSGLLSLGTSGVLFASTGRFAPNPDRGVHAFCHALPGTWHQMSVILSAASCISFAARLTGFPDEGALLAEAESFAASGADPGPLVFLPYLSGERTPHNDPHAKGVFFGLTHATERGALAQAVLEGVAFAFADGMDALSEAGTEIGDLAVVGGGARSRHWGRILASTLNRRLVYPSGAETGPAFGAARLARLAATGEPAEEVCIPLPAETEVEPDVRLSEALERRRRVFTRLYPALVESFHAADQGADPA